MRRLSALIPAAIAALAVTGCATTMNVSSHVERGVDLAQYHTYDWGPADALPTGDSRLDKDPFFQDHMLGAVEKAMATKGLGRSTAGTADLLIHYHANISERIDIDRLDRERGYCHADGCSTPLAEYEAGTLVLDVVDASTNRLIWRGWAQHGVRGMLESQDTMARQIDEAVTRMFTRFPRPL